MSTHRRTVRTAVRASAMALAVTAALACGSAGAGTASSYSSMGFDGIGNIVDDSFYAEASRDGVALPWTAPQPGSVSTFLNALSGVSDVRSMVQVSGRGDTLPGAAPVPISGSLVAAADVVAGTLHLRAVTTYGSYAQNASNLPGGRPTYAYTSGYGGAEVIEHFELRYANIYAGSMEVTLQMTLDGNLSSSTESGWQMGLGTVLRLSAPDGDQYRYDRFESSLAGQVVSVTATLPAGQCFVAQGYCESFFSIWAGFETSSRNLASGVIVQRTGAPADLDFLNTAHVQVVVPEAFTVVRSGDGSTASWVVTSAVPEPASWALLLAGLGSIALRRRVVR